jgi:proteasome accessory factor A
MSFENTPSAVDFFSDSPPPRIIGTESECNIQSLEDNSCSNYISKDAIEASGHKQVNGFLDNGMRLYVDMGHLEIATAESLGPRQAAFSDIAGPLLLSNIVESSTLPHRGLHRYSGSVISNTSKTSGYHENFLIPRSISQSNFLRTILASHLASRIWAGSGVVGMKGFEISQKISGIGGLPIDDGMRRLTDHGNKPMALIHTSQDDSDTLGKTKQWSRLEVRFADTSFSIASRYLGLAATSLTLRLAEHQSLINAEDLLDFSFSDSLEAAKRFSNDLSFTDVAWSKNGAKISPIDYQEILAEACLELSEKINLPDDEVKAIKLWLEICDRLRISDFKNQDYAGLEKILDLAARHYYLSNRFESDQLNSYNYSAVSANLTWDRILPIGGAMKYWANNPQNKSHLLDIEELVWSPPQTRAYIRGNLIASESEKIRYAFWSYIMSGEKKIELFNPYEILL